LSVSAKWHSLRPDQIDELMKGSVHFNASAAGRWKAFQAVSSADTLSMLVVLKVEMGEEPLPLERRSFSACAISLFCVVTPSWTKTARLVVSCGRVKMAATASLTAEVRVMLNGTLPPSMITSGEVSHGR
jgi:hypothetical protein